MVSTEGEVIREAAPADKREVVALITDILVQEQGIEFGRQIKVSKPSVVLGKLNLLLGSVLALLSVAC